MKQFRLAWQNRQDGNLGHGDWRDTAEHVTRIADNANAANNGGGMLRYWVEHREVK